MNKEQFTTFVSSLVFMSSTTQYASVNAASISNSTISSSVSSVSLGHANGQAVISGQQGKISLNGDRVEVRDGRVTWNGVSYGAVGKKSIVTYVVDGSVKRLFVDGVERLPDP
ncbi:uncharacterized protein sS8_1296 [Methylocaldum marinum]|uniref:Uncharacterized protein n=1 Tax=Methylocaldum marinum TaxID=1432792 RepID=A0A250KNY6_9GAMM|nr:hypothetical protein [Methylocaldum marinum]BBA33256.1 uncharacterized protein sS8_1296 [Methylocaldum marinum]